MCVVDISIAAVIIDSYILAVILEDMTCMSCITAAVEACQRAAVPNAILNSGSSCMRLLFISPGCTILQIEVQVTNIMHIIAILMLVSLIFLMSCNAFPIGISIGQRHIKNAFLFKVYKLCAAKGRRLHAMQTVDIHITGNRSGSIAGNAVLHIDIERTFFNTSCIVVMRFIAVYCCCDITAANRYLIATFLQQNCTAMDTGNIYRTINCYSRANAGYTDTVTIIAHSAVTFCFDIADCQRTVDNNISILATYNNAAYSCTLSSNIGNFHRTGNIQLRIIALSKNTICAIGIIIRCRNRQLLFDKRIINSNIRTVSHKNTCSLCAPFYCRAQSQTFAGHFHVHRHRSLFRIKSSSEFAVAFKDCRFGYFNLGNAVGIKLTGFADILGIFYSACIILRLFAGRLIVIIALTWCLGPAIFGREGNIAGFQCCGRRSQAVSNLHYTGQITVSIVFIEQLACQVVQYVGYFILSISGIAICKAGGDTLIICNKGDSRAFSCISNIKIAANNLGRISSIMLIEYSGMTAIIYNRNRIVILLVNQACIICILAAMQCCQRAACPYRIFGRYGRSCYMRLLFVSPGCTVLQIQVELANVMRSITAGAIVIIILVISCNALPERILISQCNIENACVIPVNQLAAGVFHNLLAILAGCIHITGNLGGRIACSAVIHVDIQRAFIYADCIEIMRFIAVFSCSNSAAANRYLGISTPQPDTAAAYTGDIYRTCNSNRGCVTGYQNTGSIHACTIFSDTLDIGDCQRAIDINLALLALDINAGCGITLSGNISNFYRAGNIQMCVFVSIDAMSASGIRIVCCNRQLLVSRLIDNLDMSISACINSCCLSASLRSI